MKIAILGARGIPACYSGYDTLVEEVATGLVKRKLAEVIVYCRSSYYRERPREYQGVKLVYLSAPHLKGIESLLHSFMSSLDVLFKKVDIIYFVDPANAPFCLMLRLLGKRVVIHTDGLGWNRKKWGAAARKYYKMVEWLSARVASVLVTDNPAMEHYYLEQYGAKSSYISYGAESSYLSDETIFEQLRVTPGQYLLVVARLEPENNTDLVIEQYVRAGVAVPLIVVGDSPYDAQYLARLRELAAEKKVIFAGRVNDQPKLNALYQGAYLYIHGHEVGGTNPSLLRAMKAGAAPLVVDVPFNNHVIGDAGFNFKKNADELATQMRRLLDSPELVREMGLRAKSRVEEHFTWEQVITAHANLFHELANR